MIALLIVAMFVISACASGEAIKGAKLDASDRKLGVNISEEKMYCNDSDGNNTYTAGTVYSNLGVFDDECEALVPPGYSGRVKEYICDGKKVNSILLYCFEGDVCEDGACVFEEDTTPPTLTTTWVELDNGFQVIAVAYDESGISLISGELGGPVGGNGGSQSCNNATYCNISFTQQDGSGWYNLSVTAYDVYNNQAVLTESNYFNSTGNQSNVTQEDFTVTAELMGYNWYNDEGELVFADGEEVITFSAEQPLFLVWDDNQNDIGIFNQVIFSRFDYKIGLVDANGIRTNITNTPFTASLRIQLSPTDYKFIYVDTPDLNSSFNHSFIGFYNIGDNDEINPNSDEDNLEWHIDWVNDNEASAEDLVYLETNIGTYDEDFTTDQGITVYNPEYGLEQEYGWLKLAYPVIN